MKRRYNLSRDGAYSLRLQAEFNKCIYCGKFIRLAERERGEIGLYDPTGPMDYEPRERLPFHKRCKQNEDKQVIK